MILAVKWTLGIVAVLMAYMMMLTAMAHANPTPHYEIIRQIAI